MESTSDNLCAICGIEQATTRDHIPPKSIFLKPRPQLITVPSCSKCNNDASINDEAFKVFLSMHAAGNKHFTGEDIESRRLFTELSMPTIGHNSKLRRKILDELVATTVKTDAGLVLGKGYKLEWDSKAHNVIIERTIRGLYYHHFGEILGNSVTCRVQWLKSLDKNYDITKGFPQGNIGEHLIYKYNRAEESPKYSMWVFQFYQSHWASGYTIPIPQ